MQYLIRSEVLKLRTVRGPWLLLAAGPVLVLAGISGLADSGTGVHDPAAQARKIQQLTDVQGGGQGTTFASAGHAEVCDRSLVSNERL